MQQRKSRDIPWINDAVGQFSNWLIHDSLGEWNHENITMPGIFRWTVNVIRYEGLYKHLWNERWFQDGIRAFGLISLESEGAIELFERENHTIVIRTKYGNMLDLTAFLDGHGTSIRHDPEHSDLLWDPVSAMYHVLCEYDE